MNKIDVYVNFQKGTCKCYGSPIRTGDYNSSFLNFIFDDESGKKIFRMISPDGNIAYLGEIKSRKLNLYTIDPLSHNLTSLFDKPGKYIFEIEKYTDESKITSVSSFLQVYENIIHIDNIENVFEHENEIFYSDKETFRFSNRKLIIPSKILDGILYFSLVVPKRLDRISKIRPLILKGFINNESVDFRQMGVVATYRLTENIIQFEIDLNKNLSFDNLDSIVIDDCLLYLMENFEADYIPTAQYLMQNPLNIAINYKITRIASSTWIKEEINTIEANEQGNFCLPIGIFKIEVSAEGYKDISFELEVTEEDTKNPSTIIIDDFVLEENHTHTPKIEYFQIEGNDDYHLETMLCVDCEEVIEENQKEHNFDWENGEYSVRNPNYGKVTCLDCGYKADKTRPTIESTEEVSD